MGRLLSFAAVVALAGCSYDPDKSDLTITVNGISQSAADAVNRLDVTITLPDGSTQVHHPTFGVQSTTTVVLSINTAGQQGPYTVNVVEFSREQNTPAVGGSKTAVGILTPPQSSTTIELGSP